MDHVPQTEHVRFDPVDDDPLAYGRILADLWDVAEGLAVVEQDIVIRPDVVDAFLNCPEPWCCYPYECRSSVIPMLGCTRFDSKFLCSYPDAMEEALTLPGGYGPGHYRSVDYSLFRDVLALKHGLQPHCHLPPVEHLNEQQRLSPLVSQEPVLTIDHSYGLGRLAR